MIFFFCFVFCSDSQLDYSRHSSLDYRKVMIFIYLFIILHTIIIKELVHILVCYYVFSQLYLQVLQENGDLKEKLQETQLQLNESKVHLEKLKQVRGIFILS